MIKYYNIPFLLIVFCTVSASALFAQKKEALEASRYGFELERQDKFAEALFQYNKAIAADPKYPYPVERIGAMYQKLHNYPRAIEFLRRAIALDPNFDDYNYYNLGYNYKTLHKLDSALIYYKIFLQRMKPLVAEDSTAFRDADFLQSVMTRRTCWRSLPKD